MDIKKTFLIVILLVLNLTITAQGQENKILFKINNEIITSLDIFNEMKYLKSVNAEFKKTKKDQAFEISKNSLIREKIKEIELKKLLGEITIEDKVISNVLINYFRKLDINNVKEFNQYFFEKLIDPEVVKKKLQ